MPNASVTIKLIYSWDSYYSRYKYVMQRLFFLILVVVNGMRQNMEHQKDRKGREDALGAQDHLNIIMNRNILEIIKYIMIL